MAEEGGDRTGDGGSLGLQGSAHSSPSAQEGVPGRGRGAGAGASLEREGGRAGQELAGWRGPTPRGGGSQILGQGRVVFRALSVTCLQFFIIIYPVTANLFLHIFPLYCFVFRE